MENPEIKACPFCGSKAELMQGPHGKRIQCRHDSSCLIRGQIVYDFNLAEWNRRAGDRQPATPETVGVKALASATGSAASPEIKHVFQMEIIPKQKKLLRKIWDDFAVDGGMILMQPVLNWGPFEIQKCQAQGFVINKAGASEISAIVSKAQQQNKD